MIKRVSLIFLLGVFAYGLFIRPFLPSSREIVDLPPPCGQISFLMKSIWFEAQLVSPPLGLGLALLHYFGRLTF